MVVESHDIAVSLGVVGIIGQLGHGWPRRGRMDKRLAAPKRHVDTGQQPFGSVLRLLEELRHRVGVPTPSLGPVEKRPCAAPGAARCRRLRSPVYRRGNQAELRIKSTRFRLFLA